MANSLKMVFTTATGTTTHSYAYADEEATSTQVATLASTIITNNSLFANAPLALKSAKIVTTTERDLTPGS